MLEYAKFNGVNSAGGGGADAPASARNLRLSLKIIDVTPA